MTLLYSHHGSLLMERTSASVRRDGTDSLAICVVLDGCASGSALGRDVTINAGDAGVYDMARQLTLVSSAATDATLVIPREQAKARGINLRALHGLRMPGSALSLLRSNLSDLRISAPTLTLDKVPGYRETIFDLLSVSLRAAGARVLVTPQAKNTAAFHQARALIKSHLASPHLSIHFLCKHAGVSRSALYRLFEREGGVFAYVWKLRMEQVIQALSDPLSRQRIGDLAERWGFADASHLSREFSKRYGLTPRDFRADARGAGS